MSLAQREKLMISSLGNYEAMKRYAPDPREGLGLPCTSTSHAVPPSPR